MSFSRKQAILMTTLSVGIFSSGLHANEVVFGTGNFELNYGGAIRKEAPEYLIEIPVSTQHLASSIQHDASDATISNGNMVWDVSSLEGETLLRMYTMVGDKPVNAQVLIANTEMVFDTAQSLVVPAIGADGEVGELRFTSFSDASVFVYNLLETPSQQVGTRLTTGHGFKGNESPAQAIRELQHVEKETTEDGWESKDLDFAQWTSSFYTNPNYDMLFFNRSWNALSTYFYTKDMQLIFPDVDYPEQWSAVIDMEVVVF